MYTHGITFGGHPTQCAIALKNIEIMKRERIVENVRDNGDAFRATLEQLLDLPIAGDLRGTGFFYALELVKDKETRETFTDEECETLLRGFLSPQLFEKGLICRADDRGDPVIQISPPLIATQTEFDTIAGTIGEVLSEAWQRMQSVERTSMVIDKGLKAGRSRLHVEHRDRRRLDGARLLARRDTRVHRRRRWCRHPRAGGADRLFCPDPARLAGLQVPEPRGSRLRHVVRLDDAGVRSVYRVDQRLGDLRRGRDRDGVALGDRRRSTPICSSAGSRQRPRPRASSSQR